MTLLTERHAEQIAAVVSCYDRLVRAAVAPERASQSFKLSPRMIGLSIPVIVRLSRRCSGGGARRVSARGGGRVD
jgi:hypothetical protein